MTDLFTDTYVSALGGSETLELVTCTKNVISDHEVKDKRPNNTDPDQHVIRVDANILPLLINPAPDLRLELADTCRASHYTTHTVAWP